ncbi:MAG: hypothetical protein ACYSRP_05770 [Planctomycetota bacterium]|jgi:hypothetical protein
MAMPENEKKNLSAWEGIKAHPWITVKGIFEVAAWIAIVVTGFLNYGAFQQQKRAIHAEVFNNLTEHIRHKLDSPPDDPYQYDGWHDEILNAFEYFAFLANHHYLDPAMVEF